MLLVSKQYNSEQEDRRQEDEGGGWQQENVGVLGLLLSLSGSLGLTSALPHP